MSEKLSIAVPVKIGGKKRMLKYTLGALKKFQDITGIDILSGGLKILDLEAEQFRALVYAGLGEAVALKKLRRLVDKRNAVELVGLTGIALKMSLPDPPEKKDTGPSAAPAEKKPTDWLEMWRYGRMCLRLSEAEFWGLTSAQFFALAQEQGWEEYRGAFLCMCFANYLRDAKQKRKPFTAGDFMPERWGIKRRGELTQEQIARKFDAILNQFRES